MTSLKFILLLLGAIYFPCWPPPNAPVPPRVNLIALGLLLWVLVPLVSAALRDCTMHMGDDPGPEMCGCGSTERVGWSPVFAAFICEPCRITRVHALLKAEPVTAIPVRP